MTTIKRLPYKYSGFSYTFPQNSEDQPAECSVYELFPDEIVIHSINCQQLINCRCTPKRESDRLEAEWMRKIQELHRGRNAKRRAGKLEKLQQSQQQLQEQEGDHWNPLGIPEEEI